MDPPPSNSIGVCRGYIGIMERKMEATHGILGLYDSMLLVGIWGSGF